MKKNLITAMAFTMLAMGAQASTPRGVDRANLDPTVAPGTDFYEYACGGWMKANPLTDEYSRFGTFDQLGELNRRQVHDLVLGLHAENEAPGTNARKIADLFAMGMDSVRLNREGDAPLRDDLLAIGNATRNEVVDLLATMPGLSGFFGTYVEADMLNADQNTMYWMQGGLGLGDRDYYIENSENTNKVLMAYRNYLHTLANLIGMDDAAAYDFVGNVINIETELAKAAMSREELRDPAASYNPMSMVDIAAKYPAVDLRRYFAKQGINDIDTIVVGQPASLQAVNEILRTYPEKAIRDYLIAGYLQNAAAYLSDDFTDANFEMAKVLSGVKQQQPRWKRALSVPNGMMGEALGQLYVAEYFPPVAKEKMTTLVKNLQTALGQHISNLTWMSDETKARALEKLASFTVKIGYPDKWIDYTALTIDPSKSYWQNVQAAIKFNSDLNTADYGKPVDKDRWYMSPQTVNAYYNPTTNEICFPAGILQAPYFNPDADDAENYGAIGVVIGHEMTHGFDDQGRQFDKDGNFSNWWTDADASAFTTLADALAAQFDAIEVAPGVHANGRFTLGENIADQGGLRVAYTAYHNALAQQGNPGGTVIDGFTPDQRFYLAYANVWAGNIREAEILKRTKTDPHSLGRWRVNASLRNCAPFFEAFGITEGQPMFRPETDRVVIW
ncbi:MAG: M13 family metallopeptidase [Odoribacter sp.]|nr:M13 family metallopeptidase [Odoribacter sp.]